MADYFISDLHLRSERPDITRAFLSFLGKIANDADRLYLLGDIFEAWIGDDAMLLQSQEVVLSIKQLVDAGCEVFFQHGNRDFLVGQCFSDNTGVTLLDEAVVVILPNQQRALLMHGDQLCTDDIAYQQFRALVRSAEWQSSFLNETLNQRIAIAKQLRDTSKASAQHKSNAIMDVNLDTVAHVVAQHDVSLLIHGHTHRPAIHQETFAATRIVLGDWDRDLWYLRADRKGFALLHARIEK